jgi:hypothetical protein
MASQKVTQSIRRKIFRRLRVKQIVLIGETAYTVNVV